MNRTDARPATIVTMTLLTLLSCLLGVVPARAQGKQAIVILKAAGAEAPSSGCDGTAEISYQIVYDLKLNNEDEVRLLNADGGGNPSASVSRKEYESSAKSKLRDLVSIKWGDDGVLYAVSGQSPLRAVPDNMKPQKNADQPLSAFYSVMLTGEAREGKQKRKLSLSLRETWKVYFVTEGASINDTLFKHAAEEKSVALWESYLKRTSNYRGAEANGFMRDALITCSRGDLEAFARGDYASLEKARQRAGRAQSVKDDEVTQQLAASIRRAQEKVDAARERAEQLIRADKWDEAIDAAEPVKIYLTTWPDLKKMYEHALKQSHEMHLFAGEGALRANRLEEARSNCTTAWNRLPDSVQALKCVCESRNQIALRDSVNYRQQKRPGDAKSLLEAQVGDHDCPNDPRVASALKEANCEYGRQLLAEARQLLGVGGGAVNASAASPKGRPGRRRAAQPRNGSPAPPTVAVTTLVSLKPISAQNKKDFREARAKLVLASQLCPEEAVRATLEAANRRLAEFCLEEARKAVQRGHYGTAYVYLQTAQGYTPGDGGIAGVLAQARERFQQQTRVSVGVVLENSAGGRAADQVLAEVAAGIESVAAHAGLSQAIVLDRREAAGTLRGIQNSRDVGGPTVIFSGDLIGAGVRRSDDPRYVRSSYSYSNPRWEEADRVHDAANAEYKRCVKQNGEPACGGLRDRVSSLRAYRDQFPRNVTEYYTYRETLIKVEGSLRMSLRVTDSVSRSTRAADTLEASVSRQCVQREGTNPRDYSARDSSCDVGDEQSYLFQMSQKIKTDAHAAALSQLSAIPLNYYARARSASNRQQGVEDYLLFFFLTGDKSGGEAQEAQRQLVGFDPELKTDGVMR
jgi:hypothetical protein